MKITAGLPFEAQLQEYQLAFELLKRRLRTSYVTQVIKTISLDDLRAMYRMIHPGSGPRPGITPTIQAIPRYRESYVYMSLFAAIYRSASLLDIKTKIDIPAILFAWDFFCERFPNHIREHRPYYKIRPANFNEAWIIAQSLTNGLAVIEYCKDCHGDSLIIQNSDRQPICQICAIDRKREKRKSRQVRPSVPLIK